MKSPVGQWHRYHIEVLSLCLEEKILLCPSADLRAPPEKRTPQSAGYKRGTQVTGFPVILSMRLGLSKTRLDRLVMAYIENAQASQRGSSRSLILRRPRSFAVSEGTAKGLRRLRIRLLLP